MSDFINIILVVVLIMLCIDRYFITQKYALYIKDSANKNKYIAELIGLITGLAVDHCSTWSGYESKKIRISTTNHHPSRMDALKLLNKMGLIAVTSEAKNGFIVGIIEDKNIPDNYKIPEEKMKGWYNKPI